MMNRKLLFVALALLAGAPAAMADEGMWMINAINSALEKKMQERGLTLSAKDIYDADAPGAALSDAVVSMEFGCTGSMISDKGLLITNHHCAYGDVHALSTPECNYLENGFWALNSADEIPIKGKNVLFLKKVIDITDEINAEKARLISEGKPAGMRRISAITEKKYSDEYGCEAILSSMWSGSKYYVSLYTVYSDVRLVAAPPVSIAAYGGDIDNWEWPQHKCDFAMYRIYTAPDGSPAEYSPENVPFKPARTLPISLGGYEQGDFTMVIGYPGRTSRYNNSFGVNYLETESRPISNALRGRQMEIINRGMSADPDTRLKYSDRFFSLSNVQEYYSGEVLCFGRFGVAEHKREQERELEEWINADPARKAKWGNLLEQLAVKYAALKDIRRNYNYYRETLIVGTRMNAVVNRLYAVRGDILRSKGITPRRTVENLPPTREETECCETYRFIGKEWDAVKRSLNEFEALSMDVEKELFLFAAETFYETVDSAYYGPYQKQLLRQFVGADGKADLKSLALYVWDNSFLTDEFRRDVFVSSEHTIDDYFADPLVRFMQDIKIIDFNRAVSAVEGVPTISDLSREYTHALYEMRIDKGIEQYPDANSTMRITYGTVSTLEPYDAVQCSYFSTTRGLLEKHDPSSYEFNLGGPYKTLLESPDLWGRWAAGDAMNVDFLTDNDITGGNSGSPVLNARGELIGLAFDGNKESLAGDAMYVDGYNKCVCTDIRYVLFILDRYAGMSRILEELGF